MRVLFFFFTFLLATILCCVAMNPFRNTLSLSIFSQSASHSPLFLASLSSVFQDPAAADNNDAPVSLTTTAMVSLPPRSMTGTASEFWQQPDGEGYRPCLHFSFNYRRRSSKIAKEKMKFLMVLAIWNRQGYRYQKKVLEQLRDGKGNDGSNASGQDIKSE
ncbi:hypothetical protein Lser_V15G04206 [Lactuca serriola]